MEIQSSNYALAVVTIRMNYTVFFSAHQVRREGGRREVRSINLLGVDRPNWYELLARKRARFKVVKRAGQI